MTSKLKLAACLLLTAAYCNSKAQTSNRDTTFHSSGNPVIKHKFSADPGAMVYKDKFYLYTGHDVAPPRWLPMPVVSIVRFVSITCITIPMARSSAW